MISTLMLLGFSDLRAQFNVTTSHYPQNVKLSFVRDLHPVVKPNTRERVSPYVFNKFIPGTGEKFSMVGAYVNLYENRLKLNINNISEYMFNSTPWALVSLNFQF